MTSNRIAAPSANGARFSVFCPTALPQSSAFLWNRLMLVQLNCRGYVTAQHMQPEPSKYSHGPALEQRTFMQPEPTYYDHHPGRFVYIKDEADGDVFSVTHDPVRAPADRFEFSAGDSDVRWDISRNNIDVTLQAQLPADDAAELWRITVTNPSDKPRVLSVYPAFSIGYMSWMNQSARYDETIGGIIACSISPYQKLEDYEAIRHLKDCTFLLHDTMPDAWETSRTVFEGNGGLHTPDGIAADMLSNADAIYEPPIACLQYRLSLAPGQHRELRFVFGPAKNTDDIRYLRERYLATNAFEDAYVDHQRYLHDGKPRATIDVPDATFSAFTTHWLSRQVLYHGQLNRLTTDPQTRNYLQDAMGMAYIDPALTRDALVTALSQQRADGCLPEGVILSPGAALKYINEIPHTDHCVWLPICLDAYLKESGDYALLQTNITDHEDRTTLTVHERLTLAMQWLIDNRDERGLSLIAQGDWCDPMNMVGHGGHGVSGWLSIATVYALKLWRDICTLVGDTDTAARMDDAAGRGTQAAQEHLWDGDWFARGITDAGRTFGSKRDAEGRLFLNPQSWALMAGVASDAQCDAMIAAVEQHLATPFGVMLLAPAFTHMHEDIGRITQKFPGTAENGSVYNHAAMFYIYALYLRGESERGFTELTRAIPSLDEADLRQRGQLPVFIPNYYRGAYYQHPRTAGRSSQLFQTGAASWFYRIVIEQLFGLRGCDEGLLIAPQLPDAWPQAHIERTFRGARFIVDYERRNDIKHTTVEVDKVLLTDPIVREVRAGHEYRLRVSLPETGE